MGYSDIAIVIATFFGPIAAVQAQKWLEAGRAKQERQRSIFRTLMSTRAARLSAQHVEALNSIPIEFYGRKDIINSWKSLLDHFTAPDTTTDAWVTQYSNLFVSLMHRMAQHLGYDFSEVEIKNDVYWPKAHGAILSDQEQIRRGLADMFAGKFAIPMDIKSIPATAQAIQEQDAIRQALLTWLKGEGAVTVELKGPNKPAE